MDECAIRSDREAVMVDALAAEFGESAVSDLQVIGGGLESVVFRANVAPLGRVAVKLPLMRVLSTGNEAHLDTSALLIQEERLARLAREAGLPCPKPLLLRRVAHGDDVVEFLVSVYVEIDGTSAGLSDLGSLVAEIHRLRVEPTSLVAMEGFPDVEVVVARRLGQRLRRLRDQRPDVPQLDLPRAFGRLDPCPEPSVLLYMDARPANLLVTGSRIEGIVDWSNALVGPPALELARIAESGNLTSEFLAGYGTSTPFGSICSEREVLYRLDTAVMLAHVFSDNDAAPEVQDRQVGRVIHLSHALATGERPSDEFVFQPDQPTQI
jgi:thiamine kinase-like enzyme